MHPTASLPLVSMFVALTLGVVAVALLGVRRARPGWSMPAAAVTSLWLAVTLAVGASGVLLRTELRPPPLALVVVGTTAAGVGLGVSRVGGALAGLPLWVLVGFQGFRLPLELVMHAAHVEGVMPGVMSFSGRNFDIVTGALACVAAVALSRGAPRAVAWAWVALAFATLGNVVFVAVRASPLFAAYGPGELNVWIAYAPFVWLPTVLVSLALAGQIVVVRALRRAAHA